MRSLLLLALLSLTIPGCAACRGPSPDGCTPPAAAPEPRAEGDGPPPAERIAPPGRNCAELAGREPIVPPLCGPPARSCAPPCPPPQRVIVEVVHRHEKPPCPPPAPAPMPAQPPPTMASPTLLPVQAAPSFVAVPGASAVPRVGLGFALDFFRLPIPFLRPIPVALPAEQPAVMLVQAPPTQSCPVMATAPPPQQFAHVPVSGTALVPVPPGPPSVMASPNALPPAMVNVCPPCPPVGASGPGLPSVSASTLDALTREVDALRRAMEGAKR